MTGEHVKSKAPVKKVTAGGAAGALVVLGVYVAGLLGVSVPAEVASAVTVLVSFGAAYVKSP